MCFEIFDVLESEEHCISAVSYRKQQGDAADAEMDIVLEVTGISQAEVCNGGNEPLQKQRQFDDSKWCNGNKTQNSEHPPADFLEMTHSITSVIL